MNHRLIDLDTHGPVPLCDADRKIVFMWSAKAGCTFGVKWFLAQLGKLDEALEESGGWIHNFRSRHFTTKGQHGDILREAINNPEWTFIQFVRNPVNRIVSAYLAYTNAAATGSQSPGHTLVLNKISKHVKRKIIPTRTFSFWEFLDWVQSVPEPEMDIHVSPQSRNEVWSKNQEVILIPIENADHYLPPVERRLGIQELEKVSLSSSKHHLSEERVECSGVSALWFGESLNVPMPTYGSFVDSETAPLIKSLYHRDIEKFKKYYQEYI